jgi:hypothetical protein
METPIYFYKTKSLTNLKPSSLIAVKGDTDTSFLLYVTDNNGLPYGLNPTSISNSDGTINLTSTVGGTSINLSTAIKNTINSALQSGDNISALINDAGYITGSSFALVATSGDYNDLINKPTFLPPTNHTHAIGDVINLQTVLNTKIDKNTPIIGGTFTKVTVDTDGLITSGTSATTADIADSPDKRYISDANLAKIDSLYNTNTGDETTATIQAKRPLKTVNSQSLEGSGNISVGGETNTASNVGTTGVGVFKQKSGADLEFKKLKSTNNKVTIVDGNEVDITVNEANLSGIPQSAITNLETVLTDKASISHTHSISDVTNLQTVLDSKAPSLGIDDNYITDAEKVKLSTLSGINSGDQTLTHSSDSISHTMLLSGSSGSLRVFEGAGINLSSSGTTNTGIITISSTFGDASNVSFSPSGDIEATNVQSALQELDSEKENISNKQNNLDPDGTGTKFPTVDAVFNALFEKIGDVSDNKMYVRTQGSWVEIDLSTSSIEVDDFEYATGLQQFNLSNTASQILSVSVNGWSTENYTVINSDTILINDVIGTGQKVVIRYLTDLTTGISPYYTKLQTDALIAGVGGVGGGSVAEGEFIASDLNLTAITNVSTVTFSKAIYTDIGKTRTIYLSMYVTPTATGGCGIRLDLIGLLANFTGNLVGSGTARSGIGNYNSCTVQSITGINANITFKVADTNQHSVYLTITYKIT